MRLLRPALLSAVLLAASLPAAAQPSGAPVSAEAEERRTRLFKEGKAAGDAGQWPEAAEKFRQVVAIRSAPKALIALGVAEEHAGHLVAAHAAFKQAREEAADKALTDDLKTANTALESIRLRIPQIIFSPNDALTGADLRVDGNPAQPSQGVLLVDPGEHRIMVTAPGKGDFRAKVSLNEGEQRRVTVVFGQSAPEGPATTEPSGRPIAPGTGSSSPPVGAIVVGGLGLVAAGVGGALYGLGSAQYDKAQKECDAAPCTKEIADRGNAGRVQIIAGDVLLGVGAAAVVGAGIWWIVSARSSKKVPETTLLIAPRIGGVEIRGSF
jgi:hypothetical protein